MAPEAATTSGGAGATLALFILIVVVVAWIALRQLVRALRAGKAKTVVGASFADFAREALVNAATIDGRVSDDERVAVARAMAELSGGADDEAKVATAFVNARLTKDELVDYLAARSHAFSNPQKMALLKALLAVFAADGNFDEAEHAALIDYTAAIGFDRQSAPERLRGISRQFVRGSIT